MVLSQKSGPSDLVSSQVKFDVSYKTTPVQELDKLIDQLYKVANKLEEENRRLKEDLRNMRDKKESYQYSIKQEMQHMKFELEQEVKIKDERIKELEEEN